VHGRMCMSPCWCARPSACVRTSISGWAASSARRRRTRSSSVSPNRRIGSPRRRRLRMTYEGAYVCVCVCVCVWVGVCVCDHSVWMRRHVPKCPCGPARHTGVSRGVPHPTATHIEHNIDRHRQRVRIFFIAFLSVCVWQYVCVLRVRATQEPRGGPYVFGGDFKHVGIRGYGRSRRRRRRRCCCCPTRWRRAAPFSLAPGPALRLCVR
jgi:hypothetical protein